MKSEIDELRLQRLVDGVLDDRERHEFLAAVDQYPDRWRDVALAFIEEQFWRDALPARSPAEPSTAHWKPGRDGRDGRDAARRTACTVIALAAGILLMTLAGVRVGYWWAWRNAPEVAGPGVADPQTRNPDDARHAVGPHDPQGDVPEIPGRLRLVYGDGPSRESLEVPVFEESQLPGGLWAEPPILDIERINRELAATGYQLDWQTEYLGGDLHDGRQLVVPVRSVSLQYRGQ
jgi:hypothetical protein